MIHVSSLTKSYGPKKGVFDLSFHVKEGEIFGFIGPNGAGKTTTIRHLLGFIHPDQGACQIMGLDTFKYADLIQQDLGYIPGEITFFDHMTALEFLHFMAHMRKLTDLTKMHDLIAFLELDINGKIKKMSKGMKQKLALVVAFMHDPKILILDEPTSGLDPLMQTKFVELIHKEKHQGKTILMSSHSFEEIERTCDRAGIIKHGVLVALEDIKALQQAQRRIYLVSVATEADAEFIKNSDLEILRQKDLYFEIAISGDVNPFIHQLAQCKVKSLEVKRQSLEEIFMDYYKEDNHE